MEQISMVEHFKIITDPRINRTKKHNLLDILVISVCAMIGKCETWVDIEEYGHAREEWFHTFLKLPNGIPSHDTFGRVFSLIDPLEFQKCFYEWVQATFHLSEEEVIAIDGKLMRGTMFGKNGESKRKNTIGTLNAWATTSGVALAHRKIDFKDCHESKVYAEIIQMLNLKNKIVTIDAAGCHAKTTNLIVEKGGDYCVTLKQNQSGILRNIKDVFVRSAGNESTFEQIEKGHGRIEKRKAISVDLDERFFSWKEKREHQRTQPKWIMRSVTRIETERLVKDSESREVRYILSSLPANADKIMKLARSHWAIENKLHWILDTAFDEDHSTVRKGHAPENMALIRKFALNLVRKENTSKRSINGKRLKTCWQQDYLLKVLYGVSPQDFTV